MHLKRIINRVSECIGVGFLKGYAGCLIAAIPVLAPYRVLDLPLIWLLGAFFLSLAIVKNMNVTFLVKADLIPIYLVTAMAFLLSINGLFELNSDRNLINSMLALVFELVIYMTLWCHSDVDNTMKYANLVGFICCGYACFQILMRFTGNAIPLGKLPLLEIPASQGWVTEHWGYRFNSLFSEPSYFAIYLLPLFAYNLIRNNWVKCGVFATFIVISSSSLGILTMAAVLLWYLFWDELITKRSTKLVVTLFSVVAVVILVCLCIPALRALIGATLLKISRIFTEDNSPRLIGNIEYFAYLPIKEQLFGVGLAQLQNYFAERGIAVSNYSNSCILTLLNFGVVGCFGMVLFLLSAGIISWRKKSFAFFVCLLLVFLTDSILFSYRYYYLIYFIWNYCEGGNKKNEDIVCNLMRIRDKYFGHKK